MQPNQTNTTNPTNTTNTTNRTTRHTRQTGQDEETLGGLPGNAAGGPQRAGGERRGGVPPCPVDQGEVHCQLTRDELAAVVLTVVHPGDRWGLR